MKRLFLTLGLLFLLSACGNYSNLRNPPANQKATGETDLDFATIKREILEPHCLNCHSPTKDYHIRYAEYGNVAQFATVMLQRIETGNPSKVMPKNRPPLPDNLKAMFREWVEAGAPEFKGEPQPKPKPAEPVSFEQVKKRVLEPYNCTGCHTQYQDYNTVYLDRDVIGAQILQDKMPFPKRKNRPVELVKDEDKKLLLDWLDQGAPEFIGAPIVVNENPELKPNWISLRNQVFGPKCILCHNTFGNRGGGRKQSFGTHLELRSWLERNPDFIKFDKQEGDKPGLFVESMEREPCDPSVDPLCFFSAMPFNNKNDDVLKDIERITEEEMKVIKEWIQLRLPYDEEDL